MYEDQFGEFVFAYWAQLGAWSIQGFLLLAASP